MQDCRADARAFELGLYETRKKKNDDNGHCIPAPQTTQVVESAPLKQLNLVGGAEV